jgi:hypothetical protein
MIKGAHTETEIQWGWRAESDFKNHLQLTLVSPFFHLKKWLGRSWSLFLFCFDVQAAVLFKAPRFS